MRFNRLFKDPNHKEPEPEACETEKILEGASEAPDPTYGYSARISGNEVEGYHYSIMYNGRYSRIISYPVVGTSKDIENVEKTAKRHLADLRKKKETALTKDIV